MFEATENKSRWLFLKSNLVLKNNVEQSVVIYMNYNPDLKEYLHGAWQSI